MSASSAGVRTARPDRLDKKHPSVAAARRVAVNATVNRAFGLILVQTPPPMGKFRRIVGDNISNEVGFVNLLFERF